jgi:hypothetical protein
MLNHFSLIGSVPVVSNCEAQFQVLVEQLEPQGDDLILIQDGFLHVFMDSDSVPYCFIEPARKALFDFCAKYATEAALFQSDQGVLLVGPSAQVRQDKYDEYLAHLRSTKVEGVNFQPTVFCPAEVPVVHLAAMAQ